VGIIDGALVVGMEEGTTVGSIDDCADGLMEESKEGIHDGDLVGAWVGIILGDAMDHRMEI